MMKFEWEKFWKQIEHIFLRADGDLIELKLMHFGWEIEWLNHEGQEIFVTIIVDDEEEEDDYGSSLFSIDCLISVFNLS